MICCSLKYFLRKTFCISPKLNKTFLASLGIIATQFMASLKPLKHHNTIVARVLRGCLNWETNWTEWTQIELNRINKSNSPSISASNPVGDRFWELPSSNTEILTSDLAKMTCEREPTCKEIDCEILGQD